MVLVAPRRRLPSVVSAAAVLLLATAVWWQATPAHAEDVEVAVRMTDDGPRYVPAEVTIQLGDTVTWVWETNGHSVTHQPEEGQQRVFDSHPDDPENPLQNCPPRCGEEGETTFAFSDFPEPGTYVYGSKMDPNPEPERPMRGVVKVEPAPEPSSPPSEPEASQSESTQEPSPDPASSSEPEPAPEPDPEPEPEPEPEPAPEPAPPPPAEPAPQQQQAAPQSVERDTATDTEVPTAGSPRVAAQDSSPSPVPSPTFEDFPQASDPTDDTDVSGEVALGGTDDGGGTARTVWALIGGASVLGTLGAFGRTVLFADTWNA